MNLPVEVSLQVLGFLDRRTLGRAILANRRLGGIINRHRKTFNLPEIPIPPRLSTLLKSLAILTAVPLVLVPVGVTYATIATRIHLRDAGLVPESFHDVQQGRLKTIPVACTTTCDSQLQCYAECTIQYTLLDERKGQVAKRRCSTIGLSTTNESLATDVGLKCAFNYEVNKTMVDVDVGKLNPVVACLCVLIAVLAVVNVVLLLQANRRIGDAYMAATWSLRREWLQREHEDLKKIVLSETVVTLVFAVLYGFSVLYGMTFQSFWAVDVWFFLLFLPWLLFSLIVPFIGYLLTTTDTF